MIKSLKRSAFYDDSWFVRQASLESLSGQLSEKEWKNSYKREKHSQPRKTIIYMMSKDHPDIAANFIRKHLDGDNSYVVQAEMIRQLGSVGNQSDISYLESFIPVWSPRKITRLAAEKAILELKGN